MPRWESDPKGRLERAALTLFEQHGYDGTTVAGIARLAGLTERSFYRYFPDKREVLFGGGAELEAHLVAAIDAADRELGPLEVLLAALATADEIFRPREFLVRRAQVIAASPALEERELIKLASLADAMARSLQRRAVEPGTARLAVEVAGAVSRLASRRWVGGDGDNYAALIEQAAGELRELASEPAVRRPASSGR